MISEQEAAKLYEHTKQWRKTENAKQAERRRARVAAGKCRDCEAPAVTPHEQCQKHLEAGQRYSKDRRARAKQAKLARRAALLASVMEPISRRVQ